MNHFESFPARGTWIEIRAGSDGAADAESFPARGTWIEMPSDAPAALASSVVPRKGNVD